MEVVQKNSLTGNRSSKYIAQLVNLVLPNVDRFTNGSQTSKHFCNIIKGGE